MQFQTKSVPKDEFLKTVRAHAFISGQGVNIIYNPITGFSAWMVGVLAVGYTRGSIVDIDESFDSYLTNGVCPNYQQRVDDIATDLIKGF